MYSFLGFNSRFDNNFYRLVTMIFYGFSHPLISHGKDL